MPEKSSRILLLAKTPSGEGYTDSYVDVTDIIKDGGKLFISEMKQPGLDISVYEIYAKDKSGEVTRLNANITAETFLAITDVNLDSAGNINEAELKLNLRYAGAKKGPYKDVTDLYVVENFAQYLEKRKEELGTSEKASIELAVNGRQIEATESITYKNGAVINTAVSELENMSDKDKIVLGNPGTFVDFLVNSLAYGRKTLNESLKLLDSALDPTSDVFKDLNEAARAQNLSFDKTEAALIIAKTKEFLQSGGEIDAPEQDSLISYVYKAGVTNTGVLTPSSTPSTERAGWGKDMKQRAEF